MKNTKYTYSDSKAGIQSDVFKSLSAITKHIEDFGYTEDSEGIVYSNDGGEDDECAILVYASRENGITWAPAN